MQLLEYQAKELFREYGIKLLDSISSTNIEEGRKHAKEEVKQEVFKSVKMMTNLN